MTDPVTAAPEELRPQAVEPPRPERALALLARPDFRRVYGAVVASDLGDAFQYVALMWFALVAGGPLGIVAVRLADSLPALVFGFHGGLVADRRDRRRMMIGADLVRGTILVPVAVAALTGHLPLWALAAAAFGLATATCYFEPAYGALLPSLVDRSNVQQANALVRSTSDAVSVGGWAAGAGLLAFMPVSAFFAVNAVSFFVSAALLVGVRAARPPAATDEPTWQRLRAGFAALRPRPALATAVAVVAVAVTISSGAWMVGVPQLVRSGLGRGPGSFSIVAAGYLVGAVAGGVFLARRPVRRKALGSLLAWAVYLPGFGLFALAGSLGLAIAGAVCCGVGQGTAWVLVNSAAQEEVPDELLGRVSGLIALVHRGAHASGLLLVSPLFAVVAARDVFAGAAVALPLVGLAGAAVAIRATARRPAAARAYRARGS